MRDCGSWNKQVHKVSYLISIYFLVPKLTSLRLKFTEIFHQRLIIILIILFPCIPVFSQTSPELKLFEFINRSRSDSERISRMGELCKYYYANKTFDKADSVFERQIMLAESTLTPRIVLNAYFNNTSYLVYAAETKERTRNIRDFLQRALDYAKAKDLREYVALANAQLSELDLADGQNDEALRNANLAVTDSRNTENDSIQVLCAIQLGKVYQDKSDILMAYKTFTNAQNIAIHSENESLLPPVYHAMGTLYKKFGKEEKAKEYINQSLAIDIRKNNIPGQINDNIFLSKLSNNIAGKEYLQKAIELSDKIGSLPSKIEAEKILFVHLMVKEKPEVTLAFLDEHQELQNVFANTGPFYLDWMKAEIFLYAEVPDSSLVYFKKAENAFNTGYDLSTRKGFFNELALCNKMLNNIPAALFYYQKTFDLARTSSDLRLLQTTSKDLKQLYENTGDYKQAYSYNLLYDHFKDSVELLGKERDLALAEVDNVTKQQQRDVLLAEEKLQRRYNLQYMLITIIVAVAFLLLLMIGMFKVSTFMIRLMGFLSLIFFFEFIILILDNWIHHLTHGEPWKVWLIKIGIISVLLPVHHFLEHRIIRYLLSRHLITVRSRLSMAKLFSRKKTIPVAEQPESTDNITAELPQSQDNGGGQIEPNPK